MRDLVALLALITASPLAAAQAGLEPVTPDRAQLEACLAGAEGSYGFAACYRATIDAGQAQIDARHTQVLANLDGRANRRQRKAALTEMAAFKAYQARACVTFYQNSDYVGTILPFMIAPQCELHIIGQRLAHLNWVADAYSRYAGEDLND